MEQSSNIKLDKDCDTKGHKNNRYVLHNKLNMKKGKSMKIEELEVELKNIVYIYYMEKKLFF